MKRIIKLTALKISLIILFTNIFAVKTEAAGILMPVGSNFIPLKIEDHSVKVIINNGFAMTTITQTFLNPNDRDLEAIYSFPLPVSASLSEVTITIGEKTINGEVIEKEKAEKIYEDEKNNGNNAGHASKNKYKDFKFSISNVRAKDRAVIHFVYYQPLEIDTGMGRYVYPLEEGGTDEEAEMFWTTNDKVEGSLNIEVQLKSAYPLTNVRTPGFNSVPEVNDLQQGLFKALYEVPQAKLNKDFVFYYKFQDNLPGRIEVIPYKQDNSKDGSFMMVLTPGLDLKPLSSGADYIFILDISGSMQGKLRTLCNGVNKALGKMQPGDRFRIITFNDEANEITKGWINATPGNVKNWISTVSSLRSSGSTNMYEALELCLSKIKNDDRATSLILVTDAVVNTGEINPKVFYSLMQKYDIRVFGFLLGNSGNWPLMKVICEATGGFYSGVSNSDDIIGQILKAKNKITHECLHDAKIKFKGMDVYGLTNLNIGKVYHGQQLVIFGRYKKGGKGRVTLEARLTGQDKKYSTEFILPEIDQDNPELERLWALDQVEMAEDLMNSGRLSEEEGKGRIKDLGLRFQLVTDETSMLVLSDDKFKQYGIKRKNRDRVAVEHAAQQNRSKKSVKNYRVDSSKPAFRFSAPSFGGGGGALDPFAVLLGIGFGTISLVGLRKRKIK